MNTVFLRKTVKVFALFGLLSFAGALNVCVAGSINLTNTDNALVLEGAASLNVPGSPVVYYSFSPYPIYFGPFPLPDGLGSDPWAFLVTGNTMYNFTGDPQFAIYQLNLNQPRNSTLTANQLVAVPEPRSWLLSAAILVMIALAGLRSVTPGPDSVPGTDR